MLVMIIEADQDLRYQWEDQIREEGHPVLSAPTAAQASKLLKNFPLSLLALIHDGKEKNLPQDLTAQYMFDTTEEGQGSVHSFVKKIK